MHPLLQKVRSVGRYARRLLLWRGAAWWGCLLLLAISCVAGADYWFHFGERELRWLATGTVVAVAAWGWTKFVWPAWKFARSEEAIAHWIELRHPELRDRLTSAMAFLRQPSGDARSGSSQLRQAVVQDVSAAVADHNLSECLDSRTVWRAGATLLAVVAGLLAACATDVRSATIAARRLAMPWRDEAWPRRNWLVFTHRPEKLVSGQDFLVELEDRRGWLPSEVTILYWFEGDDESAARRHRMTYAGGRMTHRLPRITRSFRYRAVGGDDREMPWTHLRVVDPPQLVAMDVLLRPPPYTGLSDHASERRIRAFAGTAIEVVGRVSKPIMSARFEFFTGESIRKVPASVSGDGMSFRLPEKSKHPWRLTESGTYGWEMVDSEGLSIPSSGRSEVEVLHDAQPAVTLESPIPGANYTPQAAVPVRILIKDDLAVQRVVLQVGARTVMLDERSSPPPIEASGAWPPHGEQRSLEYVVDLREFADLQPGQTVLFRVLASDFKPQDGAPAEIAISIVSDVDLKAWLDQRQVALVQRLSESLRLQRTVHSRTTTFHSEVDASPLASVEDATLPSIDLGQRRVRDHLDGDQGAIRLVGRMLDELSHNRIEDAPLIGHLSAVREELLRIAGDLLTPVEVQLGQAEKSIRLLRSSNQPRESPDPTVARDLNDSLARALAGQEQVIHGLEELVDRLSQWAGYRLLAQEVAQIQVDQETLLREAQVLATASKDLLQLSEEERAALRELSDRQGGLAAQLDRLQQRLERMRSQFGDVNPLATAAMDEALRVLRERATNSQMRDAAQQLALNQIGSATSGQQQILEGLERLFAALSRQPEQDLARIAEQLQNASRELEVLRGRQADVAERAAAAERLTGDAQREALDRVAREEGDLAREVQQLAERLKRIAQSSAANSMDDAASRMRSAEKSAENRDAAQAARAARDAAELLDEVRQQLARDAAAAEQRQSTLEWQFVLQNLTALSDAQQKLLNQTVELGQQASPDGQLPASVADAARQLAGQQRDVAQSASGLARRVESSAAFALALDRAAGYMDQAAQRLAVDRADGETTGAQQRALDRLRQLLDALADPPPSNSELSPPPGQTPEQSPNDAQADEPAHLVAELKLLREWQLEINQRTDELAAGSVPGEPHSEEQQREFAELAAEQLQLAEMIDRMIETGKP